MLKLSVFISALLFFQSSFSQMMGGGLQVKMQSSNQFYSFPDKPKDGTALHQGLISTGVDFFFEYKLAPRISIITKLGIETKGFSNGGFNNLPDKNKFHYGSVDLNLKYEILKNRDFIPYIFSGITYGNMYSKHLESPEFSDEVIFIDVWGNEITESEFYYSEYDYSKYSIVNFGFTVGTGISYKNLIWIEGEWNRDIVSPLSTEVVNLKNRAYSINLGINVLQIVNEIKLIKE